MPDFVNPFSGMVPRKMTKEELLRAIRLDLSAEEEAVHLYMAHADATDDPLAKKVLIDIANEERIHVGEFQRLLSILAPDEDKLLADGAREVNEMNAEVSGTDG
ncbi:MAG: ferritin family protein [Candidatus Aquicultor sp.]